MASSLSPCHTLNGARSQVDNDAGALGAFLSGAGPTVLALTRGREMTVGYEMSDAAEKSGVSGTVKVTNPTENGAHVVEG